VRLITPLALLLVLPYPSGAPDGQAPPRDTTATRVAQLPARQAAAAQPATAEEFERQIAALEKAAALNPADSKGYLAVAARYEQRLRERSTLPEAEQWTCVLLGIQATDRALAVEGDSVDALIFKGILLRRQAMLEQDPAQRQVLIAQADALRTRALEARRTQSRRADMVVAGPAPAPCPARGPIDGVAPLRVGGSVKTPTKVRDVRPVYPPEAQANRVQGIVIIEVVVTARGEVVDPCVLRTVPGLESAALDAVSQWRFDPVIFDGRPWPIVMTVTVNFTLQESR
jgi:TonB family protein